MEALIEEAKANKKHKIELEVRLDNKEAISLYEKFGFVVEGTRKDGFYAEERYIDLLLMGKILED
jgi:ribosomal protein S18 acetylase RimI-like enzyme